MGNLFKSHVQEKSKSTKVGTWDCDFGTMTVRKADGSVTSLKCAKDMEGTGLVWWYWLGPQSGFWQRMHAHNDNYTKAFRTWMGNDPPSEVSLRQMTVNHNGQRYGLELRRNKHKQLEMASRLCKPGEP